MSLKNAPGFYNPAVQTYQGANSKTFTPPGLDTNLTIPELFEFHAKHSPEHPVFIYADDDQNEHVIRFPEVWRAIRKSATLSSAHYSRMAKYYAEAQVGKSEDDPPVIGILATAGMHLISIILWPSVRSPVLTQTLPPLRCSRLDLVLHAQSRSHVSRPDALPGLDTQLRDCGRTLGLQDRRQADVR